jgi:hypothetical protein
MTEKATPKLRRAFVSAYRPYLAGRMAELRREIPDGWGDALAEGEAWLDRELTRLLATDPAGQARGPLELFQEAMRFPTRVLTAAGYQEAERDPITVVALPGDLFDLAPATSQVLGEDAWRSHLAWGTVKAAAVTSGVAPAPAQPTLGLLSTDLMDRSRVEPAAARAGLRFQIWKSAAEVSTAGLVIACVDLAHPDAFDVIDRLAARTLVIAFGPHVDEAGFAAARAHGAAEVTARSVFFRRLPELIPRLV